MVQNQIGISSFLSPLFRAASNHHGVHPSGNNLLVGDLGGDLLAGELLVETAEAVGLGRC
jgi:hypothetical protein